MSLPESFFAGLYTSWRSFFFERTHVRLHRFVPPEYFCHPVSQKLCSCTLTYWLTFAHCYKKMQYTVLYILRDLVQNDHPSFRPCLWSALWILSKKCLLQLREGAMAPEDAGKHQGRLLGGLPKYYREPFPQTPAGELGRAQHT